MNRRLSAKSRIGPISIVSIIFWSFILTVYSAGSSVDHIFCTTDDMWILYGTTVNCTIDEYHNNSFKFHAAAGEVIVTQSVWAGGTARPCIELQAPDNSSIVTCDNATKNRIDTTLSQTGIYTIFVDAFSSDTGSYALHLERLIPPSDNARLLSFGNSISDSFTPSGDLDLFKFTGISNSRIGLKITSQNEDLHPCIQLVFPNNSRQIACNNASSNELELTLDQTGTYTVLAEAFSIGLGKYILELECLSGGCLNIYLPIIGLPPGVEGPLGTLTISCSTKPGEEPFPEVLEIYQNVTLSKPAAGSSHFYFYSELQEKSGPIIWQPPDALQTYVPEGEKTGSYHSGWAQCETPGLCSAIYKLKFPYHNWPHDAYKPWDGRIVRCDF